MSCQVAWNCIVIWFYVILNLFQDDYSILFCKL